jgi:hypothetical protein
VDQDEEGFEAMFPTSGPEAGAWRERSCGILVTPDSLRERLEADPAKALVMSHIGRLVSDGYAEWSLLDNGDVELRFLSGEIFLLADMSITRIV